MSESQENKVSGFNLYAKIEELLGIDLRSLALFRIAIGAIILIDLSIRSTAMLAHYTDGGVVPRSLVAEYGEQPWFLSFHMLSGDLLLQVVLFVFAALAGFALLVGYKSRVACFVCWLMTLSLHVRNPFVNNLGDWLLVDLLLWGMFLPLGAKYSIDALQRESNLEIPERIWSIATLGILLQVCFVYWFSVLHKISPAWQTDATAVAFALHLDRITSSLGQQLLSLPEGLLEVMSAGTLILEKWGPLLVFIPLFTNRFRLAAVFLFVTFHGVLALVFELGVFPFICMAAWLLFLPRIFWEFAAVKKFGDSILQKTKVWVQRLKPQLSSNAYPLRLMPTTLETLVGAFLLCCAVSSGMLYGGLMDEWYYDKLYKNVEPIVNTLNLKQRWDMFSPEPPRNDGWLVVTAVSKEGGMVDLWKGGRTVDWSRPDNIAETYQNQRWRKYMEWVSSRRGPFAESLGHYFSEVAASKDSLTPEGVRVYLIEERTLDDLSVSQLRRRRLF